MSGICESSTRDNGGSCEHLTLGVRIDGGPLRTIKTGISDSRWNDTIDDAEWDACLRILARHAKAKGFDLANYVNRLFGLGEEATNVKDYTLIGPGVAITKTNIGTAYVNILNEANGCRVLVDFTGCTEFRPFLNGVFPGTGPHGVRIIKDGDNAVLFENTNIAAQAGERELDPGWQPIHAGFTGLELVRLQGKSATGADDPIYKRCGLLVR